MSKLIYSVKAYQINLESGDYTTWLKVPCTSRKAAERYKKVLQNWWPERIVRITSDEPINCKRAEELAELPF